VCTNRALTKNEKAPTSVRAYVYWVENTGVEPVTSCLPARGFACQVEPKQYITYYFSAI